MRALAILAAAAASAVVAAALGAGCERTGDTLFPKLPDGAIDAYAVPPPDATVDAAPPDAPPADAARDGGADAMPDAH